MRVIPLENVSATQLILCYVPCYRNGAISHRTRAGNVLILLGRAANLQRLMSVIQDVDRASNSGIQMIPLHHASASQVATVLNNLRQHHARLVKRPPCPLQSMSVAIVFCSVRPKAVRDVCVR